MVPTRRRISSTGRRERPTSIQLMAPHDERQRRHRDSERVRERADAVADGVKARGHQQGRRSRGGGDRAGEDAEGGLVDWGVLDGDDPVLPRQVRAGLRLRCCRWRPARCRHDRRSGRWCRSRHGWRSSSSGCLLVEESFQPVCPYLEGIVDGCGEARPLVGDQRRAHHDQRSQGEEHGEQRQPDPDAPDHAPWSVNAGLRYASSAASR